MALTNNPPGRPKGTPKTGGRVKGTPNKATTEIRAYARTFVADSKGRAKLLEQYQDGTLNPSLVQMFYHYAYGQPKQTVGIEGIGTVYLLPPDSEPDTSDHGPED